MMIMLLKLLWKFKMTNKRGLSAVVATVLLILITIVGVGIIAGFVVPFVVWK